MYNLYDEILSKHDIPNWAVMIITVLIVPGIARTFKKFYHISKIQDLRISLTYGGINVNQQPVQSLNIAFRNNTQGNLTISNAEIFNCTPLFEPHIIATRNIVTDSFELLFKQPNTNNYTEIQCALNPAGQGDTVLPINNQDPDLLTYSPSFFKKLFGIQKYFKIRYQVRIGNKFHKVIFTY